MAKRRRSKGGGAWQRLFSDALRLMMTTGDRDEYENAAHIATRAKRSRFKWHARTKRNIATMAGRGGKSKPVKKGGKG